MVGQEQVHRHLDSALRNFQLTEGSSAWFCALTSTWGGGKTRTADELISQVTGQSCGWIDRTGAQLSPILQPDFSDGVLPVMVSYKWVIRQVEDAGRRLPFTEWIPRVTLAALIALREKSSPQLRAVLEHLETFNAPVARAVRELPRLADITNESQVVAAFIDAIKAHGIERLLIIVEEVEDPSEIRNKPGGVLGQEAYQEIKDTYLDVIPEVLKSDTERQKFPHIGFLLLCSPAVYSTIEKIPSQARRHYAVPIGRNTVADLHGYLSHLRASDPTTPDYSEALIRAAYLAVDRNMGWMNVVMYSVHRRWLEGEQDPVSLLREFAVGDPRGKEVFVENGLARIPGAQTDGKAQELLFGQTPAPIGEIPDEERVRLLAMKVLDAAGSRAFTELFPLRAGLSELLETAQREAGVQVLSGGGAQVQAGDVKMDLARLLDDLTAYASDTAGRLLLPRDREQFVVHVTTLHGISQTGAAAQYLYPAFAQHLTDAPTHFGPSFAALRQVDKRLQREDLQFRLLDEEEQERQLSQTFAGVTKRERLRCFARGFLNILEEPQSATEHTAEENVITFSVTLERTDPLLLTQDDKIWLVVGNRGASVRDVLLSLAAENQPVRPIVLLLTTEDPSQRELVDQFLANRPAIAERVFSFPLADADERLLFLKSEQYSDGTLTNLARSLLYRLTERVKHSLAERFQQLADAGVVVRQVFRSQGWRPYGDALAEVWLYLAADPSRTLTEAERQFGQAFVSNALEALAENKPTSKKETTPLVDHDTSPPKPVWPAGLARLVDLLKDGSRSVEWLTRRFFGSGAKPRAIIEQMLQWLEKLGLVVRNSTDDTYRLLTRGDVEQAAEAAQAWHDGDLARLLTDLSRYTGIQQELKAGGDELKAKLRALTTKDRLETYQQFGQVLREAEREKFSDDLRACWVALGQRLDFQHRWMDTARPAYGETLAQDAQSLEEHVRNKDIPFRDLADALGAFVNRLEKRVTELQAQIGVAKSEVKGKLETAGLPTLVFDTPAEALLIVTKRDQQLHHTTKGVMPSETLIHHLIQRNLKNAERCVEMAEQRLAMLKQQCEEWLKEWQTFRDEVRKLSEQYEIHKHDFDELARRSTDSLYSKRHLEELETLLRPVLEDAADVLEGLQNVVDGDYAEQVRVKDSGGPPYDQDGTAILLAEARKLIRDFSAGPAVSISRLREQLEPLANQKAVYANALMDERGTPTDPGLGLLRFAIGRLDDGIAVLAEQRLNAAASLRALVEEAFVVREEWRRNGPARLGDADLFTFFLHVIDATALGNKAIPAGTDWEKLGKLKDRNLLTLKLA
jgi:DNA-binding HxlR family transcriptional regulator